MSFSSSLAAGPLPIHAKESKSFFFSPQVPQLQYYNETAVLLSFWTLRWLKHDSSECYNTFETETVLCTKPPVNVVVSKLPGERMHINKYSKCRQQFSLMFQAPKLEVKWGQRLNLVQLYFLPSVLVILTLKLLKKLYQGEKNNHTDAKCLECGFFLLKAAVCNFTTVPITILITYLQR